MASAERSAMELSGGEKVGARFGQLGFLRENNFQWGDSHEAGAWNKLGLSWKLSRRKVCQWQFELNQAWLLTE